MVGVRVASGVGERLGVAVSPGAREGMPAGIEHANIAVTSKRPGKRRGCFILIL